MLNRLLLLVCAVAALAAAPVVHAQTGEPLSLADVAAAMETGDAAVLRAATTDAAVIAPIAGDPELLIEYWLSLAEACKAAGLNDEAMAAYQKALELMADHRPAGDLSLADPMLQVARLTTDAEYRAVWLRAAYGVRESALGKGNPLLEPYRLEANETLALAGEPLIPAVDDAVRGPGNFDLIDVYYATRRAETGSSQASDFYGSAIADDLNFGVAQVSVPRDRSPGEAPRPSIWRLEFRPDPNKHMILNTVTPIDGRETFFDRVSGVVAGTERKEVFVFVHGYNNTFEGSVIRTAQLAVDMNLDGAPILYAWPSGANMFSYASDGRVTADPAEIESLASFLEDVVERTGATTVNLVAHSMGNRLLTRALGVVAERNAEPLFNEVVLAAPDVGVDEFETLWPRIVPTGERFTLYASQKDRALQASELINRMRRVGDSRSVVVREGLQTVDTTAASGGLLGHDDFAGSALADFRAVMWLSLAPDRRCVLQTVQTPGGDRYWAFGDAACPEHEFEEATVMARSLGSIEKALAKLNDDLSKAGLAARQTLMRKRDRLLALMGEQAVRAEAQATPAN